jgi:hypothetical protein
MPAGWKAARRLRRRTSVHWFPCVRIGGVSALEAVAVLDHAGLRAALLWLAGVGAHWIDLRAGFWPLLRERIGNRHHALHILRVELRRDFGQVDAHLPGHCAGLIPSRLILDAELADDLRALEDIVAVRLDARLRLLLLCCLSWIASSGFSRAISLNACGSSGFCAYLESALRVSPSCRICWPCWNACMNAPPMLLG